MTDTMTFSETAVGRVAIRLYIGWGQEAGGPAWASLEEDERASWIAAARGLLDVALATDGRTT